MSFHSLSCIRSPKKSSQWEKGKETRLSRTKIAEEGKKRGGRGGEKIVARRHSMPREGAKLRPVIPNPPSSELRHRSLPPPQSPDESAKEKEEGALRGTLGAAAQRLLIHSFTLCCTCTTHGGVGGIVCMPKAFLAITHGGFSGKGEEEEGGRRRGRGMSGVFQTSPPPFLAWKEQSRLLLLLP